MAFRRLRSSIAVLLAALAVTAGCAQGTPSGTAASATAPFPAATGTAAATTSVATAAVPPTLTFTARTVAGADFNGASLAGKPVVLWFWAPWCPTCAGQANGVKATAEQLAGKVNVVGVGGLDDETAMRRFITEWKLDAVPHLSDEAGTVWKKFGVTSQSTFVLLDSRGTVVRKAVLKGEDLPGLAAALT